ncbi:WGR domain-containing protein [Noviherbaspirillum massiliense]|uniref:WGR domain-containing protein n=1 Tax=Noviherbaspirillum massiliense TaxID=1465823 RepID=UPI0002F20BF1|nr:WGR domain-containing protein [Noviherbaspirillum massiliense]
MIDQADTVTRPLPIPITAALRVNLATSKRLYCIELSQDLLGDWMLTRSWKDKTDGRVGRKQTMVESQTVGLALLDTITKKQMKLGYMPC